jgi:hypothetical protein
MPLERKRYLLTTHLAQIEAMVGLPVGVVDTQGYGWRDESTELARGYWLEPHDEIWVLWTCLPQPRFRWLLSWDAIESWHAHRHNLEQRTQMLSTEEATALLALTTP